MVCRPVMFVVLVLLLLGCTHKRVVLRPPALPSTPTATSVPPPTRLVADGPPLPPVRTYSYPLMDAPPDGILFWCPTPDPGCSTQHPWWMNWREQQSNDLVQFRYLPAGLVAESWLVNAISLVAQHPEGRTLLQEAGERGAFLMAAPAQLIPGGYADYSHFAPKAARIRVNDRYRKASTFLLANSIFHELTHLHDAYAGNQGSCYGNALQAERRFLQWLSDWMGSFPSREVVARELSAEDNDLFNSTMFRLEGTPSRLNQFARQVHHTTCQW